MTKLIVGIGVALLVAFGIGWSVGASGKSGISRALETAELRDSLLEGRGAVLQARVDIYNVNFGDASRHLEAARTAVHAAAARLTDLGRPDDAKRLDLALTKIDDAQRMAGKLNQDANALAAQATTTINEVLGGTAKQ
jgi:hypothetical protein